MRVFLQNFFWWNRCQIVLFWAYFDEELRLKDTAITWHFSTGSPCIHDNEIITDFDIQEE